jgi:hypothetical protein
MYDIANAVDWKPIENKPDRAGVYLVASADRTLVNIARYAPKKDEWFFPSANQAFTITHWDFMPVAPKRG